MNDQNNPNGVENTFFPEQPTPNNITPEVPEMPALAAAPEPTPVVVEDPVSPAPAPVVAETPVAPVLPGTPVAPAPAPAIEPAPMAVPEQPVVAPAPIVPEAPVAPAPIVPEAPVAPAPAPVMEPTPAPMTAPVAPPIAPVPPMPAPMQPAYAAAPVMEAPKKTNGLCIAAIIFAFLMPLLGLILGIAGMISAKKKGQKGKGLGIAAILFSILMPVVYVVAIFFLIGGALFGAVNGSTEAAVALQTGCASLDEYGDYEDGYVTCENYTCEYDDGSIYLSSTCNLIDTDDYEDEEEEEVEPVTPTAPTISLPTTKWLFDDNSEIVFEETGFKWYKEKDVYTDNYYIGTYKFYMGAEAETYLTVDLSSYGITLTEIQGVYDRNEEYNKENLVVLVLETTSAYIEGTSSTLTTPYVSPYYGFALDESTLDIATMEGGTYSPLIKKAE